MTARRMVGTNEVVDYVNNASLSSILGFATSPGAIDKPYSLEMDRLARIVLQLEPCVPVMLTTNIFVINGLVNGRTGTDNS